jgi:uncharacterized ferritin-like protein (DUF455 family)
LVVLDRKATTKKEPARTTAKTDMAPAGPRAQIARRRRTETMGDTSMATTGKTNTRTKNASISKPSGTPRPIAIAAPQTVEKRALDSTTAIALRASAETESK